MAAPANTVIDLLSVQMAVFEAMLLAASSVHKMWDRRRARTVARNLAEVPHAWASWAVATAALAEFTAAILLCVPAYRSAGAVIAALLWTGYLLLILRAIADGRRDIDCGCSFAATHGPLGLFQAVRNSALAATAVLIAVESSGGTGSIVSSQIVAALALLVLYAALDQVLALQPPRSGVVL